MLGVIFKIDMNSIDFQYFVYSQIITVVLSTIGIIVALKVAIAKISVQMQYITKESGECSKKVESHDERINNMEGDVKVLKDRLKVA